VENVEWRESICSWLGLWRWMYMGRRVLHRKMDFLQNSLISLDDGYRMDTDNFQWMPAIANMRTLGLENDYV
jgi:hypothetical protein